MIIVAKFLKRGLKVGNDNDSMEMRNKKNKMFGVRNGNDEKSVEGKITKEYELSNAEEGF